MTKKTISGIIAEEDKKLETYERNTKAFSGAVKAVHETKKLKGDIKEAEKKLIGHVNSTQMYSMSKNIEKSRAKEELLHKEYMNLNNKLTDTSNPRKYLGTQIISIRQYAQKGDLQEAGKAFEEVIGYLKRAEREGKFGTNASDYVHLATASSYCLDKALEKRDKLSAEIFRHFLGTIQNLATTYETRAVAERKK